jgi:hypothetical protein
VTSQHQRQLGKRSDHGSFEAKDGGVGHSLETPEDVLLSEADILWKDLNKIFKAFHIMFYLTPICSVRLKLTTRYAIMKSKYINSHILRLHIYIVGYILFCYNCKPTGI